VEHLLGLHYYCRLLALTAKTKPEVGCSDKHSSLLPCGNSYGRKSFIVQAPGEMVTDDYFPGNGSFTRGSNFAVS
jgi:hypothetical protein